MPPCSTPYERKSNFFPRVRLATNSPYDVVVHDDEERIRLDHSTLGWALCFELGLGVLALLFGRLTHVWPAEHLEWPVSVDLAVLGLLSALPLLAVIVGLRFAPWRVFVELRQLVDHQLLPMFENLTTVELALLSLTAGWGEELLFRGLIQAEVAHGTNIITGILVASFAFALMHKMSVTYFVFAFITSIYFGVLFWYFQSLWIPVIGHGVYDFLILIYLRRVVEATDDEMTPNEVA